jgi:hypothetical protein
MVLDMPRPQMLATGTGLYFAAPLPYVAGNLVLFGLGVAAAPLIVGWAHWFALCAQPHLPMAAAMIFSNALLVLSLVPGLPAWVVHAILVLLPLAAVAVWPSGSEPSEALHLVSDEPSRRRSIWALAAFAIMLTS